MAEKSIQQLHTILSKDPAYTKINELTGCLANTRDGMDKTGGLVKELMRYRLPLSFYISLIEFYQLKIEDFGDPNEVEDCNVK